ncbi:MAG: hypothetical protein HRU19_23295 [Pseudobacteriovorax sp.]|nr:hypothetical protein [Pseudobacteriovorax sp.]
MKRLLLCLGFTAMAISGKMQAKEITFYFDVFSSGPEIYPCDAGVYHPKPEQYCHYKGTTELC